MSADAMRVRFAMPLSALVAAALVACSSDASHSNGDAGASDASNGEGGGPGSSGDSGTGGVTGTGGKTGGAGANPTGGAAGTSGGNGGRTHATGGTAGSGSGGRTSGSGGAAGASGNGGGQNDTYLPWAGGPAYFAKWSKGPPNDPSFFPIAVWLQTPSNASRYKAVGINVFVGLDRGPTDAQLSTLKSAGVPTFCDQSGVWQAHLGDATVWGWLQPDEPDNAQANQSGGYDPCIDPTKIVSGYDTMVKNDPNRPVWLGFGRGVSDTQWVGRGTCTGKTDMYKDYAKGGDILSFDIYPVNDGDPLEAVPKGVDNLRMWSNYTKPVVADIEGSNINDTTRPTPAQIKSEVWMALVHGAAGIQYFCHRFKPTFSETDCLDDATTSAGIKSINAQVTSLAAVLNTPSIADSVTVASSDSTKPVDTMLKRSGGALYLFATEMRAGTTTATFTLRDAVSGNAEVLGENRTVAVTAGKFKDDFSSYGVHLYKVQP